MNKGFFKRWEALNFYWLLSLPFFCMLLFSYLSYRSAAFSLGSTGYFILLAVAQAGALSWLAMVILPVVIWLLSCKKIPALPIAVFISIVLLYFLLLDLFIYSSIRTHFDWPLLQMILSPARVQIFNPGFLEYIFLISLLGALISLQLGVLMFMRRFRFSKWIKYSQSFLLIIFLLTQGVYLYADAMYQPKLLMATDLIPFFHGVTAKRYLAKHGLVNLQKRPANQTVINQGNIVYPLHQIKSANNTQKYNIVMIAIDSWRADSMDGSITPHIADFSTTANVYKNHFSGGNSTRSGIFSLFYSVSPSQFDAFYQMGKGPVLFEILRKQNYQRAAFTSASGVSPPFHRTVFIDLPDFQLTMPGTESVARDTYITNLATDFIAKNSKTPFFLFAFYDSAHGYNYSDDDLTFQPCNRLDRFSQLDDEGRIIIRNQYKNALHFIDNQVAKILDKLQTEGVLDHTFVVITSDHGEEFNDNGLGIWGHNSNFTPTQTQVPLIVHWPGQQKGHVYHHVTSHFDIVPTVLQQILKVNNPISDYSLGKLLSDTSDRGVILMASYSNMAIFSPVNQQLAVSNRLGYFQMQDIHGAQTNALFVDSNLLNLGYQQLHHFVEPANVG